MAGPVLLQKIKLDEGHVFKEPVKRINDGEDVAFFLMSNAYRDIMTFLFQLNVAMFPQRQKDMETDDIQQWELESTVIEYSPSIIKLRTLLDELGNLIGEAPPDTGPRRFGNVSFRKWYDIVATRISGLLDEHLPAKVLSARSHSDGETVTAKAELQAYIMGSFGSKQRLDYGTGHELSFLAFLGGMWKLGAFEETAFGIEERGIVLGVIEPYLRLVRRLIMTYTLEPAGSHGVWGLDDHSFLPYIFGSAQLSPVIADFDQTPTEGSIPNAPDPGDVAKPAIVERERNRNMYFSAIGFIYDVKKGPFWEHSPILYDISGVKAGWAKINKGMLKMYNAEVLSKFPVVQHFPFGSMFRWEKNPEAVQPPSTMHSLSQPQQVNLSGRNDYARSQRDMQPGVISRFASNVGARAPFASHAPQPVGREQNTNAQSTGRVVPGQNTRAPALATPMMKKQ